MKAYLRTAKSMASDETKDGAVYAREGRLEWSKTTSSHTACAQGAAMPYGTPFLPPAGGAIGA